MDVHEIDVIMWNAVKYGYSVRVITKDENIYVGEANWYSGAGDTETGYAEFVVETEDEDVEIGAEEIEFIEYIM